MQAKYLFTYNVLSRRPFAKKRKEKKNIINIGKTGHKKIWVMEIFIRYSYSRKSNILKLSHVFS